MELSSERIVTTDNKLVHVEANLLSGSKVLRSKEDHVGEIRFFKRHFSFH
jgi:phage FluMu protein gp41